MSEETPENPEALRVTEEDAKGPLVLTEAPEAELVDQEAEPVPDEVDLSKWVGTGPPLTGGKGRFARYTAHNLDIHKLPEQSCAPGISEAWNLRSLGYAKTKKKEPSGEPLYEFVGAEIFSSPQPVDKLASKVRLPGAPDFDCAGLPHTLLINMQLPHCEKPALFGQQLGGKTVHAALVFNLKKEVAAAANDPESSFRPAVALLRRYIEKLSTDVVKMSHDDFLGRMKLLVRSADGVPSAFAKYNGKPVLVTGSGRFNLTECGILEVGVNMRNWAYPARLALYSNWDRLGMYRLHVGLCIEGRSDEELPERLIGCCMLALPTQARDPPPFLGENA